MRFNDYYSKFLKEKLIAKESPTGYSTGLQGKSKQESPKPMNTKKAGRVDVVYDKETDDKDLTEKLEDETVQYDKYGFATIHHDGVFYLIFNDEVVGEYDTIEDLKAAHEHVLNKIQVREDIINEWELASTADNELDKLLHNAGVDQLSESRLPNVEYVEKAVKGVIDKVIAKMESYMGGSWTRLNTRYMRLEKTLKMHQIKRDELNKQITDKIASETFDPADELYTRVVETNDAVFTLAKATMRQKKPTLDAPAMIENLPKELQERLDFLTDDMLPELTKAIELLTEKYTTTYEPQEVKPALRVRRKTKFSDLGEDITEEDQDNNFYSDKFVNLFKKFFNQYDKELNYIKNI